jgi:thiocyanate hydrolase gamma subunit
VFTADDHRRFTEFAEQIGPAPAARHVAKAWLEPEFKRLALGDAIAASREVGVGWLDPAGFGTPGDFNALHVLEDTPNLHHVVVCTPCSCYPRPLLGNSPEWYRTPNYRRRIVRWPRQVLGELGLHLSEDVEVRVEDSNRKHRFVVLPVRPAGTEGWSERDLMRIVTRDCLIGVALPKPGVTWDAVRAVRPALRPVAHD